MKRRMLVLAVLPVLVFALAGVAQAWQGRMGGMGDPYGLVQDESDSLIHPAKIAHGEGIRFYGDYRFTYTGVTNWDFDRDYFTPAGVPFQWRTYDMSGDVYEHDALVGASFPLGPGRMGLFFEYSGERGNYDGDYFLSPATEFSLELASALDDFALRLLYGLPVGGLNLGGEVQISYRGEEHESFLYLNNLAQGFLNMPDFGFCFSPYDSSYWDALFKGSLEGMVGPLDVEFTLHGGFIFAGDNNLEYQQQLPVGTPITYYDLDGGVDGWRIGGNLWLRYPVDSISLPFLVRIDYQEKTRDGDGTGPFAGLNSTIDYESTEKSFDIEVGGGVEKEFNEGTRIAGGIYYQYLQRNADLYRRRDWIIPGVGGPVGIPPTPAWEIMDVTCPDCTEHQGIVRLAGEYQVSPVVVLRAGVNGFLGWMRKDLEESIINSSPILSLTNIYYPRDGLHWGIGASLGASMRFAHVTFEPFVTVGYEGFDLSGDGDTDTNGVLVNVIEIEETRNEWYIGGGCSFLFDLP
jgi:hypothetical protein